MKQRSFWVALALLAASVLVFPFRGQVAAPPGEFPMRTFFSVRSALPDETVPAALREQFGRRGRALVRESFSVDKMVEDLYALYRRLLPRTA